MVSVKAAVWRKDGAPMDIENVQLVNLEPHEILVRVGASNVSISDYISLHPANAGQPLPQILGHAASGTVEAIGSAVERLAVGDRVVVTGTPQCGECHYCVRGRADFCIKQEFLGPERARLSDGAMARMSIYVGSFADMLITRDIQATRVETDLPDDQLSLIANAIGVGMGVSMRLAPVEPGSVAVAVGAGSCGLSFIQGAKLAGASKIIAVDPLPARRALALKFGATHVVDSSDGDPVEAVCELSGDVGGPHQGRGGDYVFESCGNVEGQQQSWAMTRATGHLTLSTVPFDMSVSLTFPAVPFSVFGKTVHSCQQGGLNIRRDIPWIVRLAESGQIDIDGMIDRRYKLEEVNDAIAACADFSAVAPTLILNK
jgi:S-(hydroxymethyl)glutathione dehydrogenase / alcohol dehydrogenase